MPKTNLQRRASYYERIINEATNSPHAKNYQVVCNALRPLVTLSEQLKGRDRKMTPAEYKSLVDNYTKVLESCKIYIEKIAESDDFEKDRKAIIQELGSVLSKDMKALRLCNPMEPGTLSDVMEKSRTYIIELKRENIKTVGGNLSSRIPFKTEDGKKGFFTPKKTFNLDAKWKEKAEKYEAKFSGISEKCVKRMKMLHNIDLMQQTISKVCPFMNASQFDGDTIERLNNMAYILGMVEKQDQAGDFLSEHPDVFNDLYDFAMEIAPLANQERVMKAAGIEKNADITGRNSAMSDIARLFGCSNLLAESRPMTAVIDGIKIEGVFMEVAEGSDIGNIQHDDLLLEADAQSFENPKIFEQLADLQVIDFICGNTDRHSANIIYQFKKDGDGNIVLGGIKGIDNDCAFGTPEIKEGTKLLHMVNPGDMKFISSNMAKKLCVITPEMLREELMNSDLSEKEIDAACERMQQVKTALEAGKLDIKNLEQWDDYMLSTNNDNRNNYYDYMRAVQAVCQGEMKNNKRVSGFKADIAERTKDIHYAQAKSGITVAIVNNLDKITRLKDVMNNAKAAVYDSSEFKSMKKRFEKIETFTRKIKEDFTDKELDVPKDISDELVNSYLEMIEKTEKYVELKKLVPSTERGKKRIAFANELLDFGYEIMDRAEREADKNEALLPEKDEMELNK